MSYFFFSILYNLMILNFQQFSQIQILCFKFSLTKNYYLLSINYVISSMPCALLAAFYIL